MPHVGFQEGFPGGNQYGLADHEVLKLRLEHGFNEIETSTKKSWLGSLRSILFQPMVLLLVACVGIYFAIGDKGEALLLIFSLFVIIAINFYQEQKAEKTLQALKELSSPRTLVIRNGERIRIASRELVPGDTVLLQEGDRVPADCEILRSDGLLVDESMLTGESFPVEKNHTHWVHLGTMVSRGSALAKAIAIGSKTRLGKIGKKIEEAPEEITRLQKETGRLVWWFGTIGIIFCFAIAVIVFKSTGDWKSSSLAGISTAMSLLPEEFPIVFTLFLTMGAWRISKQNVLTRKLPALENLGAITTLCVDKTGTLTLNKMSVHTLLSEDNNLLCFNARLASSPDSHDPIDVAMREKTLGQNFDSMEFIKVYPLTYSLLAVTGVWKKSNIFYVSAKGAPEAILEICKVEKEKRKIIQKNVEQIAEKGERVLAVATAEWSSAQLPVDPREFDFKFLGLIGFRDPLRPETKPAIRECQEAGIRVIIITGDHPTTARSIAHELGFNDDKIITNKDLDSINDVELKKVIKGVNIFSRVQPEQKLRIINALKSNRDVVAMTGDGVNDALSLKWADVGIAMGKKGTDVAREAADLVLVDDNFASIVKAIELGRRIFQNIRRAMLYVLAIHVPIAGMALVPILLGYPMFLYPAHIVFLELIIDPASSLVFEAEPGSMNLMNKPPRPIHERIVRLGDAITSFVYGFLIFLTVWAIFYYFASIKNSATDVARTVGFVTLIVGNLSLIFSYRTKGQGTLKQSFQDHPWMYLFIAGSFVMLLIVMSIEPVQKLFKFSTLKESHLFFAVLTGLVPSVLIALALKTHKFLAKTIVPSSPHLP